MLKKIFDEAVKSWRLTLICLAALAYSIKTGFMEIRSEWIGAAAILLLGIIICVQNFRKATEGEFFQKRTLPDKLIAWGLLIPSAVLVFSTQIVNTMGVHFSLFLFCCGFICWFCGRRTLLWMVTPVIIFLLIVPLREQILLFISYPLRLTSTAFSVVTLQMFNIPIENQLTTIHLEGADIAITDACSGIQQFEAMVLIAYVLVQLWNRRFFWKLVHYLFLLPAIIIANSIRIILIIVLFRMIGDVALSDFWHITLGYVQVILALALIYTVGFFLPEVPAKQEEEKNEAREKK